MEYFKILPLEITLDILSRVPTESVLECKSVCRNWRSLVSQNPSFSKMHFKHHHLNRAGDSGELGFIALPYLNGKNDNFHYFEYNENAKATTPIERIRRLNLNPRGFTGFLGSCNGLICLSGRHLGRKTYICNPITREYIKLPEMKRLKNYPGASSFGYVSSTNEYKVVTIVFENGTESMEVHVYTLGSGHGWRNLGKFNFGTQAHWGKGIFVNGALYWLDSELEMIVPFDLAEEEFCEHLSLPLPPEDDFEDDDYELGVLVGCLSFTILKFVDGALCWDVWLLNKKNHNDDMKEREGHQSLGWSELFRVYDHKLFAVTKSYTVLTYNGNHINIHNPEASTSKTIVDFKEQFSGVFPHKNTLVSLKELGEEDTMIMESVEIAETENHHQPFNQP